MTAPVAKPRRLRRLVPALVIGGFALKGVLWLVVPLVIARGCG